MEEAVRLVVVSCSILKCLSTQCRVQFTVECDVIQKQQCKVWCVVLLKGAGQSF